MEELTYGQELVGLTFNPGNNPDVDAIKRGFAALIDFLYQEKLSSASISKRAILDSAMERALDAQMWAVKGVTWTAN